MQRPGGEDEKGYSPQKPFYSGNLAQINQFQVLAQDFRHDHEKHSGLTRGVAGLINRRVAQSR